MTNYYQYIKVIIHCGFFCGGGDFELSISDLYLPTYLIIFYSSSPACFRTRCFDSRSCQRHWNIPHIQKHYPYKKKIPLFRMSILWWTRTECSNVVKVSGFFEWSYLQMDFSFFPTTPVWPESLLVHCSVASRYLSV